MTLLTVAKTVAINVGIEPPDTVVLNTDPGAVYILQFSNEAGRELARRVDWSALRKVGAAVGTGSDSSFQLPADYVRLTDGLSVMVGGGAVRGGLSSDEWNAITPSSSTPRYFRVTSSRIYLHPYPLFNQTVSYTYQSKNWTPTGAAWGSDTETALVPEDLIEMGAIWRMKRHLGAAYQDYMAEFEAALADRAKFDGGVRLP